MTGENQEAISEPERGNISMATITDEISFSN
jgi:hypothetical protein